METEGKSDFDNPDTALRWESVRMARARRRLVEHELTQRRTLLLLTVVLVIAGIAMALANELYLGGVFGGGAIVPGVAALSRRSSHR